MLSNLFGDIFSTATKFFQLKVGRDIALAGGDMTASALIGGAENVNAVVTFNNKLDDIATNRKLKELNLQTTRFRETQQYQSVGSGFRSDSQSFLSVYDDTLRQAERSTKIMLNDLVQRKSMNLYNARVNQINAVNQANAVKYQSAVNAQVSSQQMSSTASYFGRLVGGQVIPNVKTLLEL